MTLPNTNSMRCVLIGADSLLMECGELLLARGHELVAVVSRADKVIRWAEGRGIEVHDSAGSRWIDELERVQFDWLFAITHLAILPDAALRLATKGSINFHDGPLPNYSGLNAPAWALLNGEATYGISWHEITSGIDEGDLLKQRLFDVADAETSLSLNTRNFEVAIDSFGELIDELAEGRQLLTKQDLSVPHSTYRRSDRPAALCVLDWRRPAAELERTVRALDFGPYANPLGSPKLWHGSHALVVTRAAVVEGSGAVGEVLGADHELVVATSDGAIALQSFRTLGGDQIGFDDVVGILDLHVGSLLDVLDDTTATTLTEFGAEMAGNESFHASRLAAIEPVEMPWAATASFDHIVEHEVASVVVPEQFAARYSSNLDTSVIAVFTSVLARLSGKKSFHVSLSAAVEPQLGSLANPMVAAQVPFSFVFEEAGDFGVALDAVVAELSLLQRRRGYLLDLVGREPELRRRRELVAGSVAPIGVCVGHPPDSATPAATALDLVVDGATVCLRYDRGLVDPADAGRLVSCLETAMACIAADPTRAMAEVDLLDDQKRDRMVNAWNATAKSFDDSACIHSLFEAQVDRSPDATAVVFEDTTISYRELDRRSNQLADHLRQLGIGHDGLVGVHVERGIELMVAVLGVLKAGGAYVPLDPTYPGNRLEHMIADSGCPVVVTQQHLESILPLPPESTTSVVRLDADAEAIDACSSQRQPTSTGGGDLAYCIYTSGSTGMPKGVLVEHRNAVNFFAGMDDVVAHDRPGTWFAVTSLSFDISVLELLYTLTRGFSVVVYRDSDRFEDAAEPGGQHDLDRMEHVGQFAAKPIDFSLFYFSGDEAESSGAGKYRLLLEGARWADEHGFVAVWTPERHFHAFGGLYPQPAITGAAVAAVTKRVQIRAGSVVMPLHHPIRVAEAWSVVDNLSDGRVGLSIAAGWQPNDFVLMPQNHGDAKNIMFRDIELVKRLWRGEAVTFSGVDDAPVTVRTLPRPVQPELPVWVTTAGNPQTYVMAGSIGANLLTHLLGQSVDQLAPKIAAYRAARADNGFDPDAGIVSLMLHTYVGHDDDEVRSIVREPLRDYLGTSLSLLKEYAWSFPAFQKPGGVDTSLDDDLLANLSDEDSDAVLEFAYLRYYETSGLFGTPASCMAMVDRLKGIGVDEIACLVDFGVSTDGVLDSLPALDDLRQMANINVGIDLDVDFESGVSTRLDQAPAAQLRRHRVTHLQCTPSMARMFTMDDDTRDALSHVEHLYVGGEAFPVALAHDLVVNSRSGNVTNMYGPTETTIWSTTWKLEGSLDTVPIGVPIANTSIYILDANLQLLPPGVPGDLWIGGAGVVRGYHHRRELTDERFVPDPFRPGMRMYKTGDLAKWRELPDGSGSIDFLGRTDHQVKLRGYRIELGEIEAALGRHADVRECVVVVREDTPGDQQLIAFVSARDSASPPPGELKDHLRGTLPEAMVPAHVIVLGELPHTPNGKIDRNGLPSLGEVLGQRADAADLVEAENDLERTVLEVWQSTLGREAIGVDDNFFDIGGHSLLIVRMHRRLKEALERPIALTELYRFPTIRGFANSLQSDTQSESTQHGIDRASRRRDSMTRRRSRQ